MKKYLALVLAILALLMVGCTPTDSTPIPENGAFVLKGTVKANNQNQLEVEIIESDYASGIYWVLINDSTQFTDAEGSKILRSSLSVGDTVEITYGGQVMMSYPPQIVAKKIKKV